MLFDRRRGLHVRWVQVVQNRPCVRKVLVQSVMHIEVLDHRLLGVVALAEQVVLWQNACIGGQQVHRALLVRHVLLRLQVTVDDLGVLVRHEVGPVSVRPLWR